LDKFDENKYNIKVGSPSRKNQRSCFFKQK